MATAADFNYGGWTIQASTPIYDGNYPDVDRDASLYTPSADSRLIYVSATGNDETAVVTNIAAQTTAFDPQGTVLPYLTISAAMDQLRDGFPDWILLKRGDTWTDETFGRIHESGRSESEPLLLTNYGTTGERPIVKTGVNSGLIMLGTVSNITVNGLDFYGHTRDPNSPDYIGEGSGVSCIDCVVGGSNFTLDNCVFRFYRLGIGLVGFNGGYNNFILKRCIIKDNYSYHSVGHSQGLYVSDTTDILIEDTLFDHNGWNEDDASAEATQFNHNVYMQTGNAGTIIVRNNIFARGSSHGLQARSGGLVENNFFIENSISLLMGNTDTGTWEGTAQNNVILKGKSMGGGPHASAAIWGLSVESFDAVAVDTAYITNNIVAHIRDTIGVIYAIQEDGVSVTNPDIANVNYSGNVVHDWIAAENDTDPGWLAPERTIGGYMASIGETGTYTAFLNAIRDRGIDEWNVNLSATNVNDYFQTGFNL